MTIKERIAALRARMKETGIDAYLIPTDDFHGSEYVGEYFKCRKYITGFTGSAGTAVIMQDMAGLWTDGRYFIQAADQLKRSTIELFKSGEPGVPTVHEFLAQTLKKGQRLGFDGRCVGASEAEELEKLLVPCADIQECIVKEKDKKICALIYCDPAKQDAVKEFVTGVNRGLPLYKRMTAVEFSTEPLPRNAMGKLLR